MTNPNQKSIQSLLSTNNTSLADILGKAEFLQQTDVLFKRFLKDLYPNLVDHCCVANLRESQLIIQIDNAAWGTQLRFITGELLSWMRNHGQMPGLVGVQVVVKKYV